MNKILTLEDAAHLCEELREYAALGFAGYRSRLATKAADALAAAHAEVESLKETLQKAADKLCHYATDYPQPDTLSIINESDRTLARGHYSGSEHWRAPAGAPAGRIPPAGVGHTALPQGGAGMSAPSPEDTQRLISDIRHFLNSPTPDWNGAMRRLLEAADALDAARATIVGVREGIEMAAQWHESRADQLSKYAITGHAYYAQAIRALLPAAPKETP